jgi:hypothetical protein
MLRFIAGIIVWLLFKDTQMGQNISGSLTSGFAGGGVPERRPERKDSRMDMNNPNNYAIQYKTGHENHPHWISAGGGYTPGHDVQNQRFLHDAAKRSKYGQSRAIHLHTKQVVEYGFA